MKFSDFPESNVNFAEDQPQYEAIKGYYNKSEMSATFCFDLSPEELQEVIATGKIWFKVLTFGKPLQPIASACSKDQLIPPIQGPLLDLNTVEDVLDGPTLTLAEIRSLDFIMRSESFQKGDLVQKSWKSKGQYVSITDLSKAGLTEFSKSKNTFIITQKG